MLCSKRCFTLFSVILSVLMLFSLSACGSKLPKLSRDRPVSINMPAFLCKTGDVFVELLF